MAISQYDTDDPLEKQKREQLIEQLTGEPYSKPYENAAPAPAAPFQGPTDASASKYAPRITERGGQTYLQEHGNERLLQPGDEQSGGRQYVQDFWQQFPTGFQPDVGGGLTATGAPVGAQTNAGYQKTGWGFDSPTGGRREFQYTPQSYGQDMTGFSGFSQMGAGSSDPTALKNIFRDAAAGLAADGFTEADVDEVIRRLQGMGVSATKVDPYQIDFGTGEGPIQVRSSRDEAWWNNRATEGQGGAPVSAGGGAGIPAAGGTPTLDGESLSRIQALIAAMLSNKTTL